MPKNVRNARHTNNLGMKITAINGTLISGNTVSVGRKQMKKINEDLHKFVIENLIKLDRRKKEYR